MNSAETRNVSTFASAGSDAPSGLIARIWRAQATSVNAPAYIAHLTERVFPVLQAIEGFRSACVLEGSVTMTTAAGGRPLVEIQVITFWTSMDAIRAFAGEDCSRAVIEPEGRAALTSFEETVHHFAVRGTAGFDLLSDR